MPKISADIDIRAFRQIERSISMAAAKFPGSAFAPYIRFTEATNPLFENPDVYMAVGQVGMGELPLIEVSPFLAPDGQPSRLPMNYVEHWGNSYDRDITQVGAHEVSHVHLADYLYWGRTGPFDLLDAMCEFVRVEPGDYVQLKREVVRNHPRIAAYMSGYGRSTITKLWNAWQAEPLNWGTPEDIAQHGHNTFHGWRVFANDPLAAQSVERWNRLDHEQQVAALELDRLLNEGLTDATAKWITEDGATENDPFATLIGQLIERELVQVLPDGCYRHRAVTLDWAQRLPDHTAIRWLTATNDEWAHHEARGGGITEALQEYSEDSKSFSTGPVLRYMPNPKSRLRSAPDWGKPDPSAPFFPGQALPLITGDEWGRPGARWVIEFDERGDLMGASLFGNFGRMQPNFPILKNGFRDRSATVLFSSRDQESVHENRVAKDSLSYLSSVLALNAIGSALYEPDAELALFTDWALARGRRFFVTEEAIKARIEQKMRNESVDRSRWGQFLYVELHRRTIDGTVLTVTHDDGLNSRIVYSQEVSHSKDDVSLSFRTQDQVANLVMALASRLVTREGDGALCKTLTEDYCEQFAGLADGPIRIPLTDVEHRARHAGKVLVDTHTRINEVATPDMLRPIYGLLLEHAVNYVAHSILEVADLYQAQREREAESGYRDENTSGRPGQSVDEWLEAAHQSALRDFDLGKLHPWDREHVRLAVEFSADIAKKHVREVFNQDPATMEYPQVNRLLPLDWRGPALHERDFDNPIQMTWRQQMRGESLESVRSALSAIGTRKLESPTLGPPPTRQRIEEHSLSIQQPPARPAPGILDRRPARLQSERVRAARDDGLGRGLI